MMTHALHVGLAGSRAPTDMSAEPDLVGRKVRLREITAADHRTLIGFDRDCARDRSTQLGGYRHWAAHRASTSDSGDNLQFAIEALHGRMLVGSMCTMQADPASERFSYGIGIGAPHRRCGYAGDAITTLLAFMFGGRGYRECLVSVYGGNLASLSLHGGLGFREQGRLRDTELLLGGVRYLVQLGVTADEFAELHPDFSAAGPPVPARRGRHWRARRGRHWQARTGSPGLTFTGWPFSA